MYETIVFDLDGTLLDTLDDLTDAVNAAMTDCSLPTHSREAVCAFVGNGIVKLIERALGEENASCFERAFSVFKAYYGEHCADKTRPYDGILSLLKELQERGIKTAVLSNKADFAVKALAKTYFDGLLLQAVGENEAAGIRKKPAPDALFAIIKELNASKENTAYVGDSEVDIQTANNAGVDCICATWGFREEAFLRANGGKNFVDKPEQILKFCGEKHG